MKKPKPMNLVKNLRHRQTETETVIWSILRAKRFFGVKFKRQQPIGNYIVDFVSFEAKLIIEIDGGQHNESPTMDKDEQRTTWLKSQGFRILRFWNNEVSENLNGVLLTIKKELEESPSL
jgi:very-short-patch-repair endonuclease